MLNTLQKKILDNYQDNFPLSPTPYQDVAIALGVTENEVLKALKELTATDIVSRIGSIIPPNQISISTLAAMSVPQQRLVEVAEIINDYPEVNHNYEREHHFNLWFVIIAASDSRLQQIIADIESISGINIMQLPMLDNYFIDLGFKLNFHEA
jgi:siroheme decarboxylase